MRAGMTSSHYGASTFGSNSQAWADATVPDRLVSSAGDRFFDPHVADESSPLFTEVNGTIIVASNGRSPMTVN
jgi:hypothetical protein